MHTAVGALLLLTVCCQPLVAAETQGAEILLAEGGKAQLAVVISPKASPSTRVVAEELARYLGLISGAAFGVETGDGSQGIVVGTLEEFPDAELEKPLELLGPADGKEAFAIRTQPDRLRLIGRTSLGASHAVYTFLESLGCRWFFEAPEWEVLPSLQTLRVNVNCDQRPVILARRIWYGGGLFEHEPQSRPMLDYAAWARRNRMAQSFTIQCGHVWQTIIAENHETFQQHPEYRALVDGKRGGEQLCVSNPQLRALVVQWSLDFLKKHPAADMVSGEPSDGGGQCQCEACKKLGTISDRVFLLANEVAKAVAKEHPGKMVGVLAYNEHSEPPSFALEPNVYVQLTAGFTRGRYTFDELLELWPQKCREMGFYDYLSVWPWDFDQLPGGRGGDTAYLRRQIPRYVAAGATSLDCESSSNWGLHGRGYYIANKLMWDPKADVDALLQDFYEKAFGPAAAPMRQYYERFDGGNKPLMSRHLLGLGYRDVQKATELAADRADVQTRLDHIKHYLRSVHLRWQIDRAKESSQKKELTLAALTHGYRTRYTYMNHWVAMRESWAAEAAKEFQEPSWAPGPNHKQPWAVDAPYTREEIDAAFQDGLAYYQPDPIEQEQFSSDLVPVDFEMASASAESKQAYQYGLTYALYSVSGEPLEMVLVPGTIAHYRDMAPSKWQITDQEGKEITGGQLALDGKPQSIQVVVPAAGLYYLHYEDWMAGWQIQVASGKHATIVLQPTWKVEHAGWMQAMYFYVPRGTKELRYYWSGSPHRVHGPDGAMLAEVNTRGEFVRIPVPEGADGKPWHFSQLMLGRLWFFNAPNYLAASPQALLVPRQLAERDGLHIVSPQAKAED